MKWTLNRQKRLREMFRFREDIREHDVLVVVDYVDRGFSVIVDYADMVSTQSFTTQTSCQCS